MSKQEVLLEVMPSQKIVERSYEKYYSNERERLSLEYDGYVPVDPYASSGISVKIVREIVI